LPQSPDNGQVPAGADCVVVGGTQQFEANGQDFGVLSFGLIEAINPRNHSICGRRVLL
jgi:hypothetical protein